MPGWATLSHVRSPRLLARMPLLGQVCLVNGAVLAAATALLLLSPFRVSAEVALAEVVVVLTGLAVVLALDALLLRASLTPVDRVVRQMSGVDRMRPGDRLEDPGDGAGASWCAGPTRCWTGSRPSGA